MNETEIHYQIHLLLTISWVAMLPDCECGVHLPPPSYLSDATHWSWLQHNSFDWNSLHRRDFVDNRSHWSTWNNTNRDTEVRIMFFTTAIDCCCETVSTSCFICSVVALYLSIRLMDSTMTADRKWIRIEDREHFPPTSLVWKRVLLKGQENHYQFQNKQTHLCE